MAVERARMIPRLNSRQRNAELNTARAVAGARKAEPIDRLADL